MDNFLYAIHKETNHKDAVALRRELLNRNFYYKGIIKDTENIVKNCSICNMKNIYNNKVKSEITNKIIIFNRPKYRYVGDITTIPNELKKNNNYQYIFVIIDHFSKYLGAYLIENKNKNSILNSLKNFIKFNGPPLHFSCDNGKEFLNNEIKKFLIDNNITVINANLIILTHKVWWNLLIRQ